jgi:hypothetical protein
MTTLTEQQTLPPYIETKRVVAHIRDTHGRALCGARLSRKPASAAKACVVCADLATLNRWAQR